MNENLLIEQSIVKFFNDQNKSNKSKKGKSIIDKEKISKEFKSNNSKENSKILKDEINEPSQTYFEKMRNNNNNKIPENKFKLENFLNSKDYEKTEYMSDIQKKSKYLQTRIISNIYTITKSDFKDYIINNYSQDSINNLNQTITQMMYVTIFKEDRVIINNEPLGPFESLSSFIETKFQDIKNSIQIQKKKYEQFKDLIFKYKKINGDGNCFYRCVMIRFIEILILNDDIENFKNLIYDILELYKNDNEIQKYFQITNFIRLKPELLSLILILIYIILIENGKELAYKVFITAILTCQIFDYGLILYLRFILYKYIKENENKMHSKNFPIPIGNLLPENFVVNEQFEFRKFYNNYLLKMFQDAEKIVIYLIPFIFNIKLNIIMFENQSEPEINLNFSGIDTTLINDEINVVITKLHYEIVYKKDDYEKFKNIFKEFTIDDGNKVYNFIEEKKNNNYNFKQSQIKSNINIINDNNKNKIDDNNKNKDKNDDKNKDKNGDKNKDKNDDKNKDKNDKNKDKNNKNKYNNNDNNNNSNNKNYINEYNKNNNDNNDNNKKDNNKNIDKNKNYNNKKDINNINNNKIDNLDKYNKDKKNDNKNNNNYKNDMNKDLNSKNETPIMDKCLICNLYNNNKKPLCNECYEELKNLIFISYFNDYLLNAKNNKNQLKISSIHEEFKNKIVDFKGQKLSLSDWINKIKLIEPDLTLEKLINRLKFKCCIYCMKEFNSKEKGIELPCKCRLCNKNCLHKLVIKCLEININIDYMCFCSEIYTPSDIFELSYYLYYYKFTNEYEELIDILNSYSLCCECYQIQKILYLIEYVLDIDQNYLNFDNILKYKSKNRFNHNICEKCYNKSKKKHYIIKCKICNLDHRITKIIEIKDESINKYNSNFNNKKKLIRK